MPGILRCIQNGNSGNITSIYHHKKKQFDTKSYDSCQQMYKIVKNIAASCGGALNGSATGFIHSAYWILVTATQILKWISHILILFQLSNAEPSG